MIHFNIDHSTKEDYFYVNSVEVEVEDGAEKERVKKAIDEYKLVGYIGYPSREKFAELLKVDKSIVDFDLNEIDIY